MEDKISSRDIVSANRKIKFETEETVFFLLLKAAPKWEESCTAFILALRIQFDGSTPILNPTESFSFTFSAGKSDQG